MKNYNILANLLKNTNNKCIGFKNDNNWSWLSNKELIQHVNFSREHLLNHNVIKGDRIAYQGKNSIEWISWNLACLSIGAIWVPMYADQTKNYCQYIIDNCKPKITITNQNLFNNTINISNRIEKSYQSDINNITQINKHDLSSLIYTSGTTGNPKGVMLSHDNIMSNIYSIEKRFLDMNYKTTSLNILPWAHIYSLTTELYYNLYKNNSIAISSDKTKFISECREIKPDVLYIVPKVLELIKNKVETIDKPFIRCIIPYLLHFILGNNIKYIFTGGSKLDENTKKFFRQNKIIICEGYGTTETSPMVSVNHHSSPRNDHSIGKLLDNIEVEIIDGEICVSGPNVMKGYWGDIEKTNEVLLQKNNKTYYKTGDTGRLIQGFLYYQGRISENYKLSNGKFVNVSDVENKIKKYIHTNFIIHGENLERNILIVEKPFDKSLLDKINSKLDKYLHIKDVIEIDDFSKYLTPKMSIKRKEVIKRFMEEFM